VLNVRAKSQRVSKQNPLNGNQTDREKTLHNRAECIFTAAHSTVKERQGRGHQENQRGAEQHEGRIAGIDLGGDSIRRQCGLGSDETEKQQ